MSENLTILRQNELFQEEMQRIMKHRPTVPPYNYDPDNTEEWKAMSNMQRGFDLFAELLGETPT